MERALKPLLVNRTQYYSHYYVHGTNVLVVSSPPIKKKSLFRSPMLWAAILGLAAGFLCLQLPDTVRGIVLSDVAKPIQSVSISLVTAAMGPLILFSMLVSVSALQSIDELTNLGFKLIGRFIVITLAVMAVGIGVSLLFYSDFGTGGIDFRPKQIIELLLGIIPTNPISPLLNNNTPQLVVLGLVLGAALLILGDRVSRLKEMISQINEWIMSAMGIILKIVPVIPFVSIFMVIAQGNGATLLNGWEFIAANYAVALLCGGIKLFAVSARYKVAVPVLWKKLWPMVSTAFSTANNTTMLKQEYEISKDVLGIKPEFSSFWIPMSQAMLNPRVTICLIIPPFLILKYIGQPITLSFLLITILLVLELSIANPGTTGGWSILFAALALPAEYVGTFMMYRLFVVNFNAGYGALQVGLEQIEAAAKAGAIDLDLLRQKTAVH
ncbi:MAG: cation:dicarboxylase symporter family transporter [Lachnospiraceae bacterium]|nr:cation:dicarboxylase symporter family transporter [Lachnospiraceae bacterium]